MVKKLAEGKRILKPTVKDGAGTKGGKNKIPELDQGKLNKVVP